MLAPQRIETDELKKLVKEWNPAYNIGIDKKSPIKWAKGMTFDKFGISWGRGRFRNWFWNNLNEVIKHG